MKWLVLGGLTLFAAVALADYNVQDKGTYYNNASTGLRTNSTGDLRVDDMSRDRETVVKYDDIINDTISVGTADSTQTLIDTHDVAKGYLLIRVDSLDAKYSATPFARFAIRVTGHTNATADSSTTFNFDFTPSHSETVSGGDTLSYSMHVIPTGTEVASTEVVATLIYDEASAAKNARRATLIVPLVNSMGTWFWAEYTGVMVRLLATSDGGPNPRCYVRVSYRGTPL